MLAGAPHNRFIWTVYSRLQSHCYWGGWGLWVFYVNQVDDPLNAGLATLQVETLLYCYRTIFLLRKASPSTMYYRMVGNIISLEKIFVKVSELEFSQINLILRV